MMSRIVQRFGMGATRRAMSTASKPGDMAAIKMELEGQYKYFTEQMAKFEKGNKSAASRARKSLLDMKTSAHQLRGAIQNEKAVMPKKQARA